MARADNISITVFELRGRTIYLTSEGILARAQTRGFPWYYEMILPDTMGNLMRNAVRKRLWHINEGLIYDETRASTTLRKLIEPILGLLPDHFIGSSESRFDKAYETWLLYNALWLIDPVVPIMYGRRIVDAVRYYSKNRQMYEKDTPSFLPASVGTSY